MHTEQLTLPSMPTDRCERMEFTCPSRDVADRLKPLLADGWRTIAFDHHGGFETIELQRTNASKAALVNPTHP